MKTTGSSHHSCLGTVLGNDIVVTKRRPVIADSAPESISLFQGFKNVMIDSFYNNYTPFGVPAYLSVLCRINDILAPASHLWRLAFPPASGTAQE